VAASIGASGRRRKLVLDVQEGRARDMPGQIELTPDLRMAELPPAIDELRPHGARD
jgi:hypothetical protein